MDGSEGSDVPMSMVGCFASLATRLDPSVVVSVELTVLEPGVQV